MRDVAKSLELFQAMDRIIVARRCGDITREVFDIAEKCVRERYNPSVVAQQADPSVGNVGPDAGVNTPRTATGDSMDPQSDFDIEGLRDEQFNSLIECNLMDGFMEFESIFVDISNLS